MKVLIHLLLLPTLILAQPWIPDPRCPGYNDSVRRNLIAPATLPVPESHEPVGPPALRVEQQRSLQEYDGLPTFQLKLHWEEGFCWQSEYDERVYCMDCESRTCNEGGIMEIQYCSFESQGEDVRDQRLQWIPTPQNHTIGRLKAASGDLCMERIENRHYALQECDEFSVRQLLIGFSYTEPFELYPEYDTSRCLNQQHDPRIFEEVELTDCSVARRVNTNRWEVIELDGDIPEEFLVEDEEDGENENEDGEEGGGEGENEDGEEEGGEGEGENEEGEGEDENEEGEDEDGQVGGQQDDFNDEEICFPSDVTVIEKSKGRIPIKDLKVGDSILGPNNKYSRVYTFGHNAPLTKNISYLTLKVESGSTVSLSNLHMIFLSNGKAVAARHIKVGDELQNHSRVVDITTSYKTGAMAPFTTDGRFLVNDHFIVSSYVDVGLSHAVAHMVVPRVLSLVMDREEYDERGLNVWLPTVETTVKAVGYGKMMCSLGVAAWLAWRVRCNSAKGF